MKLFEEFKEYEELWTNTSKIPSVAVASSQAKVLKEARSVAEIEAEIAKLKLELEQAKIAEKNTDSQTKVPTVWVYDIYSEPSKKGTWTSLDGKVDIVYETREKAIEEIKASYGHKNKQTKEIEYWWGGEQYPDFDTLFKALAEQKRLMELTIEVEE